MTCGGVCGRVRTAVGWMAGWLVSSGVTGSGDVVGVLEEVGVDTEGDVGVDVAELAGREHDVESWLIRAEA